MDDIITKIAHEWLGFDNLDPQNSSEEDYRSVSKKTVRKALEEAFKAGAETIQIKKEQAEKVPAILRTPMSKRMRELAGIPAKGNFV